MTRPAAIRQPDLERIFRASKATDYPVRVDLYPDGKIVILPARPGDSDRQGNPWDEDDA